MGSRNMNELPWSQWHPTKNGPIDPDSLTDGVAKNVWWICESGHEWQARVYSRTGGGRGCPYCSGRLPIVGVNDLASTHPHLAAQWDKTANGPLRPEDLKAGSNRKVAWKCDQEHRWQAVVSSRAKQGRGCPYCAGQLTERGVNDLGTSQPLLAGQWNFRRNSDLTPEKVKASSNKKVWWECERGHEWQAQIADRTRRGDGCPFCSGRQVLPGETDLATTHPVLAAQWSKTANRDSRIEQVSAGSNRKVWWVCDHGHNWKMAVSKRALLGQGCPICSGKQVLEGFNDLASQSPEIAKFWNFEKNGDLLPTQISAGSQKLVWFVCELDSRHEWQGRVTGLKRGRGCPICANKRIVSGINDLSTTHPALAKQWHPEMNGELRPTSLGAGSHKAAWWVCPTDGRHIWSASVESRSGKREAGCPVCANRVVIQGVNDLATTHPHLASEWDFLKNTTSPSEIAVGSRVKYSWKCSKEHEWSAAPQTRLRSGCPVCSNKAVQAGSNDLATTNPELLKFWNFEANKIAPTELVAGSGRKVMWVCESAHSFLRAPVTMLRTAACPYCSNSKVKKGFNDLETVLPDLASQWDYEKNGDLTPSDVLPGSERSVWWLCVNGHSWNARIANRKNGRDCPSCAQTGFDQAKEGITYFITNETLRASKIGITNVEAKKNRLEAFSKEGWKIVFLTTNDGYISQALETQMLRWIRKDLQLPPYLGEEEMPRTGGWSETFEADAIEERDVIQKIEAILAELVDV